MIEELAKIGLAAIGVVALIFLGLIGLVVALWAFLFTIGAATFPVWFPIWAAVKQGEDQRTRKKPPFNWWSYVAALVLLWLPGCYLWWQIMKWVSNHLR